MTLQRHTIHHTALRTAPPHYTMLHQLALCCWSATLHSVTLHAYTHTHTYNHACMHACILVHTYIYIYTHTYMHAYIHTDVHAYIHTWPGKNLQSTRTVLGVLRSILGKAGCLFLLRPMLPCKRNASILNRCGATPGSTALFRASKCLHRNELNPCFLRQSTAREPQIESAASSGAKDTLQTLGCGLSSGATSLTERTL